jgi:hypothetical protein
LNRHDDERMEFDLDSPAPAEISFSERHQRFRIRDASGQVHEYSDRSEIPAHFRELIDKAQSDASANIIAKTNIRVKINGEEQVYSSWDDVPPDVQEMLRLAGAEPNHPSIGIRQSPRQSRQMPQSWEEQHSRLDQFEQTDRRQGNWGRSVLISGGWFWIGLRIFAILGTLYLIWSIGNWIMGVYQDAIRDVQS